MAFESPGLPLWGRGFFISAPDRAHKALSYTRPAGL